MKPGIHVGIATILVAGAVLVAAPAGAEEAPVEPAPSPPSELLPAAPSTPAPPVVPTIPEGDFTIDWTYGYTGAPAPAPAPAEWAPVDPRAFVEVPAFPTEVVRNGGSTSPAVPADPSTATVTYAPVGATSARTKSAPETKVRVKP